ncbi:methyltransferase dimerization domain-containing protein [Ralstonia syzygii]|uniref:Putative O-methyltransferase family 2 n=1 Tax=Ralstonia syzygii R24 TaxID=907261 RepID=G3A9U5_9RALS|nr:methyltransferase dimerization domain-containing protein [Ralstonia syzygii]CCA88067.1 putative O-methyltransferase family 2 [Ralstonia syzygii R24]
MSPHSLEIIFAQSILPHAFFAALRFGLYSTLTRSPMSAETIARTLGLSRRAVSVLLDAQVLVGLVKRDSDARYSATEEAVTFLHPDGPGYCVAIYEKWLHSLRNLDSALQNDSPAVDVTAPAFQSEWVHYARKSLVSWPNEAKQAMQDWCDLVSQGWVHADSRVAYFASGAGVFGMAFAQFSERCRVMLLDRPDVLDIARSVATLMRVGERVEYHPFELRRTNREAEDSPSLPAVDIAIFRETLHYLPPNEVRDLLKRAQRTFGGIEKVLVINRFLKDTRSGPRPCFIDNAYMAATAPHWESYTESEIGSIFSDSSYPVRTQINERTWLFSR